MTGNSYGGAVRSWARVTLGPLEFQIMRVLWSGIECNVRDLVRRLPYPRAYTTVMTTADRLFFKGLVQRNMVGRCFVYSARLGEQDLEQMLDKDLVSKLLARPQTSRMTIVLSLVETLKQRDPLLCRKLKAALADANQRRGVVKISISSYPPGAEIRIDGRFVGSTPAKLPVNTGQHLVTMTLPSYETWSRSLTARDNTVLKARLVKKSARRNPQRREGLGSAASRQSDQ